MDTPKNPWIVWLGDTPCLNEKIVGGKAASLAKLLAGGVRVPSGFCLTVYAYQYFLTQSDIPKAIQMELGRKSLDNMRWEEMWDTALRIRSIFLKAILPQELKQPILNALTGLESDHALAVRSSALGEDSAERSFAGLHESIVNVRSHQSVLQAIQTVWASLWSDAALLYRKELALDPLQSRMAVLVQDMIPAKTSGVAFGRDPRNQTGDREIVEAVPGPCSNLVDGLLEPDRWILEKSSGKVVEWQAGERTDTWNDLPLLNDSQLRGLHGRMEEVENLFGWPPDMEWAERNGILSVLQARPITSGISSAQSDERGWYLTLRPKFPELCRLAEKVSNDLIPELEQLGNELAKTDIHKLDDHDLADCIEERLATLTFWRKVYKETFIPLAHGVRYLGAYYNDVLHPQDPYEFMILLKGEDFLASQRNAALRALSHRIHTNSLLLEKLTKSGFSDSARGQNRWPQLKIELGKIDGGPDFLAEFDQCLANFMDNSFNGQRISDRPDLLLNLLCQLETFSHENPGSGQKVNEAKGKTLEDRLIREAGKSCEQEARQVIAIGKVSWRLRDDDNILLGRIESQFLRALHEGAQRLRNTGRLTGNLINEGSTSRLVRALRDPTKKSIHIEVKELEINTKDSDNQEKPRQLVGQPASPGLAEGPACVVNCLEDFRRFHRGDILVCESIQPTMTHLVPLASAIVERRGGMLIHGAIIARELGIPCVNGIPHASTIIRNNDRLTVDGFLGIVSLGAPDFELETQTIAQHL